MLNQEVYDKIKKIIDDNDVVLFMKGTSDEPQCGFSFTVVRILNFLGVKFQDINVLADNEIREGIKDYTNWPTIPQLYIKQKFIGGCDILKEMFENSELTKLLEEEGVHYLKSQDCE